MATVTLGRGVLLSANLNITQGQTNGFSLRWLPEGEGSAGQDLTGWHARCQARRRPGAAGEAWFTVTDDPDGEDGSIFLGSDGEINLTLKPEASSRWGTANKVGTWDLELIDPSGTVITFARGAVTVDLETTTFGDDLDG